MDTVTLNTYRQVEGVSISGSFYEAFDGILTKEALKFIKTLHQNFNERRKILLENRKLTQQKIDNGVFPDFLPETKQIREDEWKVAPLPEDLLDRRVEITGPVDRKMIINALNSGAKVFMADFEDSNSPSWENNINGQVNLRDAIDGTISFENKAKQKLYTLNKETATLMVRPRGWHLEEKHLKINGENISGSLLDFGLYFFHNIKGLMKKGSGTYFYLPKLEHYLEARLWNDVFVFAQDYLDIPQKTIKATVLIETILASFQLHEILFELKDHSAGFNCGRWDYIFSFIKKFRNKEGFIFPDRALVGMGVPCMKAYSQLVIKTCHKRGVHAIGGMAAQIPIKSDEKANKKAINKVKADKLREVKYGHDGTWVAHPGLVETAMDIFNEFMPEKNQISNLREDIEVSAKDLLEVPTGEVTKAGLQQNINVGILYIESWLRGNGAAAIHHLMEDAATAEISRTQVWQWMHNKVELEDGTVVTNELVNNMIEAEKPIIKNYVGAENYANGKFEKAIELFKQLVEQTEYEEFLTIPAYAFI